MFNRTLIAKELREYRWKLLIGLLYFTVLAALMPFLQGWLRRSLEMVGRLETGPLGQLIMRQLEDYQLFLWANWYGKNLYQGAVLLAILVGMSPLAAEVSRDTAKFLFSKPFSRGAIYRNKYAAGALGLLGMTGFSTAVAYLSSALFRETPPLGFFAGLPLAAAGTLVIYSLAFYFSAGSDDQVKAGVAAALAALVLSIPSWIPRIRFLSVYWQMAGWQVFVGKGFPWAALAALLAASSALYLAGLRRLEARDL